MFFPPHHIPLQGGDLLPGFRKCGQPLQGLLPPQTASWPAHNQWLLKLGISSPSQFSQIQDNSDGQVLLQSSLPGSGRLCGTCTAVQFLSLPSPAPWTFPSQVLIPLTVCFWRIQPTTETMPYYLWILACCHNIYPVCVGWPEQFTMDLKNTDLFLIFSLPFTENHMIKIIAKLFNVVKHITIKEKCNKVVLKYL